MLRGFVTGGAWGLIVATLGVTTASLLAPQPAGNAPPGEPLVVMTDVAAAEVAADPPAPDTAAPDTAVGDAATTVATLDPPAPVGAAESEEQTIDTAPPNPPVIAVTDATLSVPTSGATLAVTPAPDTPVLPNPQAPAPVTPASEADLILSTEPAPAPISPAPDLEPAPATQDMIAVIPVLPSAEPAPVVEAPVQDAVAAELVVPSDALPAQTSDLPPVMSPSAPETDTAQADPVATPEGVQTAESEIPAPPDPVAEPVAVPSVPPAPQAIPQIEPEVATEPSQPPVVATLAPDVAQTAPPPARIVLQGDAGSLPQVAGGVRVNRPETLAPLTDVLAQPVAPVGDIVTAGPALAQFAAPFENALGKPLISVILIDDGAIAGLSDTLADVPFPVTIAINPGDPDATTRMQDYRDRGIEVLAIATLPQGAQPSDVEVTLEAVFVTLPQAVGLIDLGDGQVQSSTAVTAQTLARLAADGRGLVVFSDGLNPALRAAATAEVPAVEVTRDLDGNGQDAGTIRRFLDNAAFQARQQSGIVLLARLRPETISALILWGAENRAGQVALAPISGVLTQ